MSKSPSIIWYVGQMCSGSCSLALLPIAAFILKFYSVPSFLPGSSRFYIFILPHPGKEWWSLLCIWGEEIGRERGKEESERKEGGRGWKESRVQACISFFPLEIPAKVSFCCPWLDYMLILNSSLKWEC